jgi:hypothetical protein
MTAKTATATTTKHVLLAVRKGRPEIVSVHARWSDAINAWQAADDQSQLPASELFYAVRESDHELVAQAVAAIKLSAKQAHYLQVMFKAAPTGWIKPGSRKQSNSGPRRWEQAGGGYSTDAVPFLRALGAKGLVRIDGVDFAPKSYRLTDLGRLVAQVQA